MSAPTRRAISAAPCAHCPFRTDVPIYLHPGRREEIARSIANGETFWCHATVDYDGEPDEDGFETADTSGSSECAGAVKAAMLSGGTTNSARVAERLGLVDLDDLADHGPDVWPLSEWPLLAEGATAENPEHEDVETCGTVNYGCEAPAGFLGSNGAVVVGTVAATETCSECGDPVCSSCISADGLCGSCAEWADDEESDDL